MKAGKILIFVILTFSILFLGLAAGLYSQRLDWAPQIRGEVKSVGAEGLVTVSVGTETGLTPGATVVIYRLNAGKEEFVSVVRLGEVRAGEADGRVVAGAPSDQIKPKDRVAGSGMVADLDAQIARLVPVRDRAENRWQQARADLLRAEKSRSAYRLWYAEQLQIVETGLDREGKKAAVQSLEMKDGQLVMDPEGRKARKVRDKDAEALNAYREKHERLQKEIARVEEEIQKLQQTEMELTIKVNGGTYEKDGKKVEELGLRKQLARAEGDLKNAQNEQDRLTPETYKSAAEAQLLLKRQRELKARLKELQTTAGLSSGD